MPGEHAGESVNLYFPIILYGAFFLRFIPGSDFYLAAINYYSIIYMEEPGCAIKEMLYQIRWSYVCLVSSAAGADYWRSCLRRNEKFYIGAAAEIRKYPPARDVSELVGVNRSGNSASR